MPSDRGARSHARRIEVLQLAQRDRQVVEIDVGFFRQQVDQFGHGLSVTGRSKGPGQPAAGLLKTNGVPNGAGQHAEIRLAPDAVGGVTLGSPATLKQSMEGGGELTVVAQNLDGGAVDARAAHGRPVRLLWPRKHAQQIGQG